MAALTTEFTSRYSDARVLQLTNADDTDAIANEGTKLAQAATSASAHFETLAQLELDTDEVGHVEVGCLLMEALLCRWGGGAAAEARQLWSEAKAAAESLKGVTSRGRPGWTTDSNYSASEDVPSGQPEGKTWTDASQFRGLGAYKYSDPDETD